MATSPADMEYAPLVVHLRPVVDMTDDELFRFCSLNRDLRIERSADGDLIIMAPAGARSGARNAEITFQPRQWAKQDGQGVAFNSSAGFRLPNGAVALPAPPGCAAPGSTGSTTRRRTGSCLCARIS